jgi:hypothetical protein
MAGAVKRSSFIVFLRKVLIRFSDEKYRSGPAVVMGIVTYPKQSGRFTESIL